MADQRAFGAALHIPDNEELVLLGLVEPTTGLLAPDSSIWEHHWNGNQKHFTYSNITAVAGLCGAARLAERFEDPVLAAQYADAALDLREAILDQLVLADGALAGNLEEIAAGQAVDAAVIEAINWGLVPADGATAAATLTAIEGLRIAPDRGYARNDDTDWYDAQEWVFIDLRVATAYALRGDPAAAAPLIDWVSAQTRANHDLIAELYEVGDAAYAGAIPMAGYGGGAFALAWLGAQPIMDAAGCLPLAGSDDPPETGETGGDTDGGSVADDPTADAATATDVAGAGSDDIGPDADSASDATTGSSVEPLTFPEAPADDGGCAGSGPSSARPIPLALLLSLGALAVLHRRRRRRRAA